MRFDRWLSNAIIWNAGKARSHVRHVRGETREASRKLALNAAQKEAVSPPIFFSPQPGRWVLSHGEIRTIVFGSCWRCSSPRSPDHRRHRAPTIGREFRD